MVNILRFDTATYRRVIAWFPFFFLLKTQLHMCGEAEVHLRLFRRETFPGGMQKSLSCYISVSFSFFRYPKFSAVFSQSIVRVWKGARFHARLFPIIFMNADKSHIFSGAVSGKRAENGAKRQNCPK